VKRFAIQEVDAMDFSRRQIFKLAMGAIALPVGPSRAAQMQAYPTRPVRFIVGFAPGGATDIVARIMGQWLSERLGQQIIVENWPGAGSNIATHEVVDSPPDGYTILVITGSNAVNTTFYETLPFDFLKDIIPVAGLVRYPLVMVENLSIPAKTVGEFISYAKANPGKISMGSYGTGTTGHLAGELFKAMAHVDMVHVPYRGEAPALTDVIGGHIQVMFSTPPACLEHIRAGKVRALGVTSAMRWEGLPDLPTVGDAVAGYEALSWSGVGAPHGTSQVIIEMLNREINAGLADQSIKKHLADLGTTPMLLTPTAFSTFVAAETEKWGEVIKSSGAKPD
jgi:tripartite-type tricarboxylate transporter receptor subunit TctC